MKYRFLVLTDHRGHTQENSLYGLMTTLNGHTQCQHIDVVSRGNAENDHFFEKHIVVQLQAKRVTTNFGFDVTGRDLIDDCQSIDPLDYDVLIMRLPRPISDDFLLFLKEQFSDMVIVNDPIGILRTSNKAYLTNFAAICPPQQVCYSMDEILSFAKQFPIVLKPLRAYGGKGIFKIEQGMVDTNGALIDAEEYLEQHQEMIQSEGLLAMKFLKNVDQGDKRILVVNGEVLAGSLRMPPDGSWICNVGRGGTSIPSVVDPEEHAMAEMMSPVLSREGICIFGMDTLVGDDGKRVLSEINTLSIGGFIQAQSQIGKPILQQTIDNMIEYVRQRC